MHRRRGWVMDGVDGRNGCWMNRIIVQPTTARAEDRATVGTDPSADPGAKTERRATARPAACLSPIPFGIGIEAINPSRRSRELSGCELPGDGLPDVHNSERQTLHFTLNHYTGTTCASAESPRTPAGITTAMAS
jgi:hypothetical protein